MMRSVEVLRKLTLLSRSATLPRTSARYLSSRDMQRDPSATGEANDARKGHRESEQIRTFSSSAEVGSSKSSPFEDHALFFSQYDWVRSIPVVDVGIDGDAKMVIVRWEDGDSQQYPCVWLRCNCHCDDCYSTHAHGKLKYMQHLDLDVTAREATISEDSHTVTVTWSDGHVTNMPSNWLRCNRFDQSEADPVSDSKLNLWGSDVMSSGRLQTFRFKDLLESNDALLDWLQEIQTLGIALVKEVPTVSHQIYKLGERVGYMANSSYGTHSDVIAVKGADMLGFSNGYLQPHTDFSYCINPPAVGMFHCIKNTPTKGGESLLIDGFKAAIELKETDPAAFGLLTTNEVEHVALARSKSITKHGFYHHARHPLIRLDPFGQLKQVTFNEIYHASLVRIPVEGVVPMFSAIKAFNNILLRDDNVFKYKLEPGDILSFSNHRMLHGRNAYESDTGLTERHLQTAFFDLDCVLSRMRLLKDYLNSQKEKATTASSAA
ncbi:gamma-butyrobetaine dioxygenase-like [Diadema antillarum]|uniref:gamma-butyrobetaine dioxygenase-like n=1 Tax=Diadema antillarum TaxID=105358 RepID=UPI003A859D03